MATKKGFYWIKDTNGELSVGEYDDGWFFVGSELMHDELPDKFKIVGEVKRTTQKTKIFYPKSNSVDNSKLENYNLIVALDFLYDTNTMRMKHKKFGRYNNAMLHDRWDEIYDNGDITRIVLVK